MLQLLKEFWNDEDGAHIVEYIVVVILVGATAAAVGFGMMASGRGKTGEIMHDLEKLETVGGTVTKDTTSDYTVTTEGSKTGMPWKFNP